MFASGTRAWFDEEAVTVKLAGAVSAGSAPALPLDRLEPVIDAGEASSLYDRYWTEIQSA